MRIFTVGIVGYGSIGKKHYQAIYKIDKKIKIYFIRIKNNIKIYDKKINQLKLNEAQNIAFDCIFVCTPANTHLEIAKIFLEKNIPTFIEKPITNDFVKIKKYKNLINYINKNKVIVKVGYVLRHGDSYKKFKKIIFKNKLGNMLDVKSNCNSNLINWRGHLSKSIVSTSNKLGGGVINELSHEIDYLNDLFGKIEYVFANINQNKKFNFNTEESVDIIMINRNKIPISLHLDYNSPISNRYCEVRFEKGTIKWDIKKNQIIITNSKGKIDKLLLKSNHYMNQIHCFFDQIKYNKFQKNDLNDAIEVIKIIKLIKTSNNKRIELKN